MEEINNTINHDQSVIQPTPKIYLYKYLFFITLILLFGVTVYFVIKDNKSSSLLTNNVTTQNIEKSKQNKENQNNKNNNYKAVSIQDDKNLISKLVLIDKDNNEIIIDEEKYWQMAENTLKPSYGDFIFSLNNNFLYYNYFSGYEQASSYLYDLTNKIKFQLNFFAETKGFTSDSKYFYACSEAGMNGGGAIVRDLVSSSNIYAPHDDKSDDSYNCQYDKSIGEVTFSQLYHSYEDKDKTPSQYKFSQRTGILTKVE